jgi:hypothetical protein
MLIIPSSTSFFISNDSIRETIGWHLGQGSFQHEWVLGQAQQVWEDYQQHLVRLMENKGCWVLTIEGAYRHIRVYAWNIWHSEAWLEVRDEQSDVSVLLLIDWDIQLEVWDWIEVLWSSDIVWRKWICIWRHY